MSVRGRVPSVSGQQLLPVCLHQGLLVPGFIRSQYSLLMEFGPSFPPSATSSLSSVEQSSSREKGQQEHLFTVNGTIIPPMMFILSDRGRCSSF